MYIVYFVHFLCHSGIKVKELERGERGPSIFLMYTVDILTQTKAYVYFLARTDQETKTHGVSCLLRSLSVSLSRFRFQCVLRKASHCLFLSLILDLDSACRIFSQMVVRSPLRSNSLVQTHTASDLFESRRAHHATCLCVLFSFSLCLCTNECA